MIKGRSRWRSGIRIGSRTTSASSSRFAILLIMYIMFYVQDTDYDRLRPELVKHKLFPSAHLARIEERPNRKLELYLQVYRVSLSSFFRGTKYPELSKFVCDMKTG